MSRGALMIACLALAACRRDHPPAGAVEVQGADCIACHLADSVHDDGRTDCGGCHSTTFWLPALEGAHPEDRFPITRGPHANFTCFDCHDPSVGPSTAGQNTDCVGCHTGAHSRARMDEKHNDKPGYAWDDGNPHFCLECHPSGQKD